MYFDVVKEEYEIYKNNSRGARVENKQRLNISNQAYAVLYGDIGVFEPDGDGLRREPEVSSKIINKIFRCYRETARASIAQRLKSRRAELVSVLQQMAPNVKKQAIELLLNDYRDQLTSEIAVRISEKGQSITSRIDIENIAYLASDEGQKEGEFYQCNVGQYIKAVIEEYAEHPYVERESIYFKEELDQIKKAISEKKLLKVYLHSVTVANGTKKQNVLYMKPIKVQQDVERLYNYVVGLKSTTNEGPWELGAVRITSIQECRCLSQDAPVKSAEKTRIESVIQRNGVQYLSGGEQTHKIIVEFTPEGEKLYGRMLHLRPRYTKRDASVYEFECTLQQAENYFFRYGHNVRILEPVSLAQKFCRRYQSAAKKYDNK